MSLDTRVRRAAIDGLEADVEIGSWMFFVPATGEKFFHARGRSTDCIHPTRPPDGDLADDWRNETYSSADWRSALTTPLERRLAELWIASRRLAQAGLGPITYGVTLVDEFVRDNEPLGPTAGLLCENVTGLRPKSPCTDEEMIAAGVRPDRIRSAVRQQLRGYVVDLTSVVGVQPIDAEAEIMAALTWIRDLATGSTIGVR